MKIFSSLLVLLWYSIQLAAQPTIEWQNTFGGNNYDEAFNIKQTTDDGFIVAGSSASSNGDNTGNLGGDDFWVLKLDYTGSIQWKKALGGTDHEVALSVNQTIEGGFFLAGYTKSDDHDVSGNHGGYFDGWVVKLNSNGDMQWQKALGGSGWDDFRSAQQTTDNGYILAGRSSSTDGDVTENHGQLDIWVVKLDETGNVQWQKSLGGSKDDVAYSVKQTSDGGYIIAGETASFDGDVTGLHGNVDFWVIKLTPDGMMEWQSALGGSHGDIASDIIQTSDGHYVVTGYVGSNDGQVTGYHGILDFWIVKLNNDGSLEWQTTLGGSEPDFGRSIVSTHDCGFIIAGSTQSSNGNVVGNDGGAEFWLVKVDSVGEFVWQKTYGGNEAEVGFAICNTSDNGFALAGYAWSANNGDLTGSINQGNNDFWIVKLAPETVAVNDVQNNNASPLEIYPNPTNQSITLQLPSTENQWTISISNLQGQVVFQQIIQDGDQADISTLANGLYIVEAIAGGEMLQGKVVKN